MKPVQGVDALLDAAVVGAVAMGARDPVDVIRLLHAPPEYRPAIEEALQRALRGQIKGLSVTAHAESAESLRQRGHSQDLTGGFGQTTFSLTALDSAEAAGQRFASAFIRATERE